MIRKTILFFASVLVLSSSVSAQNWEFVSVFPPDSSFTLATHGVAVDAAGKIWLDQASNSPVIGENGDTLYLSAPLHVFNPDGTRPWDPIRVVEGDTLGGFGGPAFVTGVKSDHNGDIIVTLRRTWSDLGGRIVRFDHATGEVMNSVTLGESAASNYSQPVSPGIDENGNIYLGQVVSRGHPVGIFDSEFGFEGLVTDSAIGIARNLEVTADGNSVYWPDAVGTSKPGLVKYTRSDEFSPYTTQANFADTTGLVRPGLLAESSSRDPRTDYLWFGNSTEHSGIGGDSRAYTLLTWYALDPATDEFVDSLTYNLSEGEYDKQKTRAMGFSPDGMYVYVGLWDTGGVPSLQKFKYQSPTSIQRDPSEIPQGFTLSQNYPNPFNPQTNIEFEMKDAGLATLKVYDVLGREVATLVDEHLVAGKYTATFNATDLSSGTYVYQLDVAGHRLSGKMMLMK